MSDKRNSQEADEFLLEHPEIEAIDLLIPDINGILRGKRANRSTLLKVYLDGVCLPGSLFGLRITGDTVEETGLGFDEGDADRICRPIAGTLKPTPWQEQPMGQLLMTMHEADGQPFFADPRQVLAKVTRRFSELQLTPVVALELEFYLIDRELTAQGGPQPPLSPVTGEREHHTQVYGVSELDAYGSILDDMAKAAAAQGVPAEAAVAEYAPGQYEINLRHVSDPLAACDHAILLKRLIKGIALRHGVEATFMAKPYDDWAGNGMHVHISLLDESGNNVLQDSDPLGGDILRHAVGGLAITMSESMALFAPNANSFRRFQKNSYVPLRPSWGFNNRTTALRIPAGPSHARRIEHRVAGADANPYLLLAALLAGIHYGITEHIEPEPPVTGNAYDQHEPSLPSTWMEALAALQDSQIVAPFLGQAFCHVFVANKIAEYQDFIRHVTPLEHRWYLRTV